MEGRGGGGGVIVPQECTNEECKRSDIYNEDFLTLILLIVVVSVVSISSSKATLIHEACLKLSEGKSDKCLGVCHKI